MTSLLDILRLKFGAIELRKQNDLFTNNYYGGFTFTIHILQPYFGNGRSPALNGMSIAVPWL